MERGQPSALPDGRPGAAGTAARIQRAAAPAVEDGGASGKRAALRAARRPAQGRRNRSADPGAAAPAVEDGRRQVDSGQPSALPDGRPTAAGTAARIKGLPRRPWRTAGAKWIRAALRAARRPAQGRRNSSADQRAAAPAVEDGRRQVDSGQPSALPDGPPTAVGTAARIQGLPRRPWRTAGAKWIACSPPRCQTARPGPSEQQRGSKGCRAGR